MDGDLLSAAQAWRDGDPDPVTQAEMDTLIAAAAAGDAAATAGLADRLAQPLQFGTAGLRGALGAGPGRMNRAVVIRAAAGLAAYLRARVDGTPRVVVGYDARHGSATFAEDSAAVLTAAGCEALLLPGMLPTPVLAFCVRRLDAEAGVMVTASHNPSQDNGYKVYLGGRADTSPGQGAQIAPPVDAEIAELIAAAPAARTVPRSAAGWQVLGAGIVDDYLEAARGVLRPDSARDISLVLTPLHGVGGDILVRALHGAGFERLHIVAEQAAPDPDFPTVAFPNPEEPGALDLAMAQAVARGADLVIATDPDADRCAVALPGGRMLTGDEVGALLGEHLLRRDHDDGARAASSVVSSRLLARIAAAHGVPHSETLTGFKWISRVPGLVYGYEEALGYCAAPTLVRDKDGLTAALLVAELAAGLRAEGRSLLDALDDLARQHGVHETAPIVVRVSDPALVGAVMRQLRADQPRSLGGSPVVAVEDLAEPLPGGLPPTDGLRWYTADDVRVVVRPSGTEPKLKCYLEAVVPPSEMPLADARALAHDRLARVRADLAGRLTQTDARRPDAL